MRIEVLTIEECPNSQEAVDSARRALESLDLTGISVVEVRLTTPEEAAGTAFAGSPTVLIDGVDAVPGAVPISSLACRIYRTELGVSGYPSAAQIAAAIRERAH